MHSNSHAVNQEIGAMQPTTNSPQPSSAKSLLVVIALIAIVAIAIVTGN